MLLSSDVAAVVSMFLLVSSTVALDPAGSPGKSRKGQSPSGLVVPEPQSCEEGTCKEQVVVVDPPAVSDWFRPGSAEHVSPELYEQINVNLTALNTSAKGGGGPLLCYVAIIDDQPKVEEGGRKSSPRDFARRSMREWYGGDRRFERTLLVLLIRATNRTEIVLGSRARKKMKESAVRRVTRKANQLLAAGGEGAMDDALRHAVTSVLKALKKDKGLAGSLRAMLMPLIIGAVLLYLYFKNQGARFQGGMGGGMGGGMEGMMGGMGGGMGGMGGGMGGMGGGMGGMGVGMGGMGGGMGGMGGGMGGMGGGMGSGMDSMGGRMGGGMGRHGGAGMGMRGTGGMDMDELDELDELGLPLPPHTADDEVDCSDDEGEGEMVEVEDAEPPAASAGGEARQDRPSPLVAELRARAAARGRGN
jgi:hypothetical protein